LPGSGCNRKVVVSQLVNPVVRFDFHLISTRGKELPPGADEFTSFLKSYIATWAGRWRPLIASFLPRFR
jgi:LysR family transcriptional regulator, carnitine catabolism transcriptional activator